MRIENTNNQLDKVPVHHLTVDGVIALLTNDAYKRHVIISDNPTIDSVRKESIDVVVFKTGILETTPKLFIQAWERINVDGFILIDSDADYSQELCEKMRYIGLNICILDLIKG